MQARNTLLRLQHEELISPGFGTPDLTLASGVLPHARVVVGQPERLEFLGLGIKAQDRIRTPVTDPYRIVPVNIDGIGLGAITRQVPACPTLGLAVVAKKIVLSDAG